MAWIKSAVYASFGVGMLVAHLAIMALASYVFVQARKVARVCSGSFRRR